MFCPLSFFIFVLRQGRIQQWLLSDLSPPFSDYDFTKPNFGNRAVVTHFGYLNSSENIYYPDSFYTCTPLAVIPLLLLSNLATIFFSTIIIDKRKFYQLIPVHCREITLDFFENVSLVCEDALRHTASVMFVNVLQISLYLTVKIFSHQVPYTGNFLSPDSVKKRPTTDLVTTWRFLSLSANILDKKIQVIGFLKSGNNIIAIFTKSTWYCSCVNQIIPD